MRRVEVVSAPELPASLALGRVGEPPTADPSTGSPARELADTVTGAKRFPSDLTRPGLLHGRILRPPAFGATLASLDAREAEAVPAS